MIEVEGEEIKRFVFPGGEIQVTVPETNGKNVTVYFKAYGPGDIMELLLCTDAIRRSNPSAGIHLIMPYIPYARQDRVANPGEALSIKVFADLINSQKYKSVTVEDPHSDVAVALFNNLRVIKQEELVCKMFTKVHWNNVVLVCPDAGARKKTLACSKTLQAVKGPGFKCEILYADKLRDTVTGKISGTVLNNYSHKTMDMVPKLIVDDICDGGATFLGIAEAIHEKEPDANVFLYVTHGIFSHGLSVLKERLNHIYVSNIFPDILESDSDFITEV